MTTSLQSAHRPSATARAVYIERGEGEAHDGDEGGEGDAEYYEEEAVPQAAPPPEMPPPAQ